MTGNHDEQTVRPGRVPLLAAAAAVMLLLGGCGANLSSLNVFDSNKATTEAATADGETPLPANNDIDCPSVQIRTGAAVLSIANETKATAEGDAGALNLRYQGTIIRFARECRVAAGVMTMKVGVEGRIITGPAGGPGKVDVPLRIAVVQEGITPKAVATKFTVIPVEVTGAVDRVSFTHVEEGLSFPMPVPAALLDAYVVYIGFDTMSAQPKKPVPRKRR